MFVEGTGTGILCIDKQTYDTCLFRNQHCTVDCVSKKEFTAAFALMPSRDSETCKPYGRETMSGIFPGIRRWESPSADFTESKGKEPYDCGGAILIDHDKSTGYPLCGVLPRSGL